MENLSQEFWDLRYKKKDTGWDLGAISPPIKSYFDQLPAKDIKILIPGGGNSYEAEYLYRLGYKQVYVLDLSPTALNNLQTRVPSFPQSHLICENFFDFTGSYDLLIEQTFFCAIRPELRPTYAKKATELLKDNGKLVGVLFNDTFVGNQPPFGGDKQEYLQYFEPYFNIHIMETAYNSHPKRAGRELFLIAKKKSDCVAF